MTFKTAYNQKVQNYIDKNKNGDYKKTKYKMIADFKEFLLDRGKIYEELFPRVKSKVVEYLFFLTSTCGVWKIGAEALAKKIGCSISSVHNTVSLLKKDGVFLIARIANNGAGKYIFVNKLHPDFKKIMREVFNLSEQEINEMNLKKKDVSEESKIKGQFKGQRISSNASPTSDKKAFLGLYLFRSFFRQEKIVISGIKGLKTVKEKEMAKTTEEQKQILTYYGADEYQMMLLDLIHSLPYPQCLKDQGYKIVLRAGSELDLGSFHTAKDTIHELAMRINNNEMNVRSLPGLFQSIFKNSMVKKSRDMHDNQVAGDESGKKVPFYDWLTERANDLL